MASQRWAIRGALAAALVGGSIAAAKAELDPEHVTTIPALTTENRIYVLDIAINHIADGKVHIVDGDTLKYLGVIGSGFTGQTIVSNDRKEIIIATGYLSRGQRGERTDIVEVWDADTLAFKYEIPISDKRAMALNYEGLMRLSADGRWLFVQNSTPATSVTVVDMQAKQSVGEIDMPGCWGIYPTESNPNRFASLCGDGSITTITLGADGQVAARAATGKVFDPDEDAWFMSGEQDGDRYHFVSFKGNLTTVNVAGDQAAVESTWPMVRGADVKKGWRPGGYQPLAFANGRLYVAVHSKGAEGSHKNPAEQIWVFDLVSKKRIARMPGRNAIALETSGDGSTVYALDGLKAEVVRYENIGAKPRVRSAQVGETAIQLIVH